MDCSSIESSFSQVAASAVVVNSYYKVIIVGSSPYKYRRERSIFKIFVKFRSFFPALKLSHSLNFKI